MSDSESHEQAVANNSTRGRAPARAARKTRALLLAGVAALVLGAGAGPAAAASPSAVGLLATVKLGGHPKAVAVDPTTDAVYVAGENALGYGTVWALNGATGKPLYGPIEIGNQPGFEGPEAIAVDPGTHAVYVADSLGSTLSIIDGSDLSRPVVTVPLSGSLLIGVNDAVAVDAATDTVYVGAADGVEVLSGSTGEPVHAPLGAQGAPFGPLAFDPATDTIYAGGVATAGAPGFLWAINANTGKATVSANEAFILPDDVATDPATSTVYSLSGYLTVVSEVSNQIVEKMGFDLDFAPGGISVDPVSDTVYVADQYSGKLWALDGPALSPSAPTLTLAKGLSNVAVDSTTGVSYVANAVAGTLSIVVPYATVAPGAPTAVSAVPGPGRAIVSFTPPADGGSPITAYTATATDLTIPSNGGETVTLTAANIAAGGTRIELQDLTPGDTYTFTVTATNAVGTGAASVASNPVVPTPAVSGGRGGGGCTGTKCQ